MELVEIVSIVEKDANKHVLLKVIVNETPQDKLIRELKLENDKLKS